jgi:hypothetical protein
VRDARIVGDDVWCGGNDLYEFCPAQVAASIHNLHRRQAANEIVRQSSLPSRPHDHDGETMLTPNDLDELSKIARGPLPNALIRERGYYDGALFGALHQSNSVV